MNIYILEDDLMQQTRISDIIRELVSEGTGAFLCLQYHQTLYGTKRITF